MEDARKRKIGDNEAVFREINERINELVQHGDPLEGERIAIVCECGSDSCSTLIYLDLPEYESLRSHSARFGVVPGHEIPEAEEVVESRGRYNVVQKFGVAREAAEEHEPRP